MQQATEDFLKAYEALCREHGLCFAHEDPEGGFIVRRLDRDLIRWVLDAREDV